MTTKSWDITLHGVTAGYGDTVVLENISATLPSGKITAILGGSGCGKSTLLRHIIGLSRPMQGTVILGGHDLFALASADFRRIRRRMGVLFQDGALLGSLSVADNIALPLKEHTRLSKKEMYEIVMHKLELVGLADFAHYFPAELSGGMRKRAGLARALVTDPPILLCDEATSGLDPISAAQMDMLLLEMKARFPQMTTVCVSHDMSSVRTIADHVLVLHNKHIIYQGSLAGLEASEDPYLQTFLARKVLIETSLTTEHYPLSDTTRAAMHKEFDQ